MNNNANPIYIHISWQNQEYRNFVFFSLFAVLKGIRHWEDNNKKRNSRGYSGVGHKRNKPYSNENKAIKERNNPIANTQSKSAPAHPTVDPSLTSQQFY